MSALHGAGHGSHVSQSDHSRRSLQHDETRNPAAFAGKEWDIMNHHKPYLRLSSSAPFLIQGWSLQTVEGLLGALLITTAMSVLREVIAHSLYTEEKLMGRERKFSLASLSIRIRRTVLYMLSTAIASTVMLCVMTYNLWLLVVTILGAGLGYFIFFPVIQWAYTRASLAPQQQDGKNYNPVTIKDPTHTFLLDRSCSPADEALNRSQNHKRFERHQSENHKPLLTDCHTRNP